MDNLLDRMAKFKEKAKAHPEYFSIEFSIDRGLEYDVEMGCVRRKNPEVISVTLKEFVDPLTQKSIAPPT